MAKRLLDWSQSSLKLLLPIGSRQSGEREPKAMSQSPVPPCRFPDNSKELNYLLIRRSHLDSLRIYEAQISGTGRPSQLPISFPPSRHLC
jgi:hypothetical protein